MEFEIEFEREEDGRWIAAVDSLPGVPAYGLSKDEARPIIQALARLVIAERK